MRKIWIIFPLGLVVGIAVIGYFGYRFVADTVMLPDELAPYESDFKAWDQIESKAPAPGPDARLTAKHVKLFTAMLDSINIGADHLERAVEDLAVDTSKDGRFSANILAAPGVVRHALMAGPVTRRAIVNFLNKNRLSWEEYRWMRDRILVASGITPAEADSSSVINLTTEGRAADYMTGAEFDPNNASWTEEGSFGTDTTDDLSRFAQGERYSHLDDLRSEITVDSAEVVLVAPHRKRLLERALRCMIGADHEF